MSSDEAIAYQRDIVAIKEQDLGCADTMRPRNFRRDASGHSCFAGRDECSAFSQTNWFGYRACTFLRETAAPSGDLERKCV